VGFTHCSTAAKLRSRYACGIPIRFASRDASFLITGSLCVWGGGGGGGGRGGGASGTGGGGEAFGTEFICIFKRFGADLYVQEQEAPPREQPPRLQKILFGVHAQVSYYIVSSPLQLKADGRNLGPGLVPGPGPGPGPWARGPAGFARHMLG